MSWINHFQLTQRRIESTKSNSSLGELDDPSLTRQQRVGSVSSSFVFADSDQSKTMHYRLQNSPLWVSVELSLISSRSELPLKLYGKNDKSLFSRMKMKMVNLTPRLSRLYDWFGLSCKTGVGLKVTLPKRNRKTFASKNGPNGLKPDKSLLTIFNKKLAQSWYEGLSNIHEKR